MHTSKKHTMNVRNMISMLASRMVWTTLVSTHTVLAFQNGDTCGVTSRDFMNYDYRSDHLIAGTAGCTFRREDDDAYVDTGCFCAPNLDDNESLGVWQWQCNGVVDFGPNPLTTKTCPSTVPVAKGLGFLSFITNRNLADEEEDASNTPPQPIVVGIGTESQQQKQVVACDQTIHPTGHPGDEVCPYSDCDAGGDHSAICACVNLAEYGMGDGMQWICMHGTCNCADDDDDGRNAPAPQDATSSLPPSSAPTSVPPESAASSHGNGRYWWLQSSGSIIAALYFMTLV